MNESLQTLGWIVIVFIAVPVMFLILISVIHAIQYKITGIRLTRSLNKLLKKVEHISFENNDKKP